MELSEDASQTSCPSPYTWFKQFEKAENSIAVTISGNLSGSYNSAKVAQQMIAEKYPEKNVAIIDSCSAGPELILIIENIYQLIHAGMEFDDVVATTCRMQQHTHVTFALCSFHNLIKNGRMNKYAGLLAGKLGFWGIGIGTEEGTIQIKGKARGKKKAIAAIVDDIKERAGVATSATATTASAQKCSPPPCVKNGPTPKCASCQPAASAAITPSSADSLSASETTSEKFSRDRNTSGLASL